MVGGMSNAMVAVMSTKESSIGSDQEEEYESLQKYFDNKFASRINLPTCYRQSSPALCELSLSDGRLFSSRAVLTSTVGRARRPARASYAQLGAARQAAPLEAPACPNPKACLHYLTLLPAARGIIRSRSSNRATS